MKKVYEWENETWPEFKNIKMCKTDAGKYIKKLARHFKTERAVAIDYSRNKRNGGGAYYNEGWINLSHETDLSIVVHEFAHHLTHCKWGPGVHHGKKFKTQLKRVYRYAKRWL